MSSDAGDVIKAKEAWTREYSGHFEEYFYDEKGKLTEIIDMLSGGVVLNIPAGQWHSLKCLESGTVLLEAKDGKYEPLGVDDLYQELEN